MTHMRKTERDLHPLPEARRRLGDISAASIYRWEKQGKIKLVRIGGRTFMADAEIVRLANGGEETKIA